VESFVREILGIAIVVDRSYVMSSKVGLNLFCHFDAFRASKNLKNFPIAWQDKNKTITGKYHKI
jgi:hypothetical protein